MTQTQPTSAPSTWTPRQLEQHIADLVYDGHDDHAIAEHLADLDVSHGEYDGCSTDLELAFAEYQHLAARMRDRIGRLPGYVVDEHNPAPGSQR